MNEGKEGTDSLSRLLAELARAPEVKLGAMHDGDTAPLDPLLGAQVGEYVVRGRIGSGGMGVVYEGVQPVIGKRVALKVLQGEIAADPEQMRRFLDEARAVNAIRHRGIVDIFSFGQLPDGRQYFVMELLEGQPLDEVMRANGPLSESDAIAILDEVLGALAAAHAAGVLHRDLKPANVFLVAQAEGNSYAKLLDFGLAKKLPDNAATTPQTRASALMGTPLYISPEQASGLPIGPATDLYALGVMAFELLTGQPPFTADNVYEVVTKHIKTPPPRPSSLRASVSPGLDDLVLKLLAKDPAQRPASASQVRSMLRELPAQRLPSDKLAIRVTPARADVPAAPLLDEPKPPRFASPIPSRNRSRLKWAGLAAAVAVAVVAAGVALDGSSGSPDGTWAAAKGDGVMVVEKQADDRYSVTLLETGSLAVYQRAGRVLSSTSLSPPVTMEFSRDYSTAVMNVPGQPIHFRKLDALAAKEATSRTAFRSAQLEARTVLNGLLDAERATFAKQSSYDEALKVDGCPDGTVGEKPGVGWSAGCHYAYQAVSFGKCPDCELELRAVGISEVAKGDEWLASLRVTGRQWGPNDVAPPFSVGVTNAAVEVGSDLRVKLEDVGRPDYLNIPELQALIQRKGASGDPCAAIHAPPNAGSGVHGPVSRVLLSCVLSKVELGLRSPAGDGRVIPAASAASEPVPDRLRRHDVAVLISKAGLTIKVQGEERETLPRKPDGSLDDAGLKKRMSELAAQVRRDAKDKWLEPSSTWRARVLTTEDDIAYSELFGVVDAVHGDDALSFPEIELAHWPY